MLAMGLLSFAACNKDQSSNSAASVVGEWQLSKIDVKSVSYAGQTVEVYLSLQKEGGFELYQMVGQGRFRKFTGSWKLEGKTLSGTYASNKAWGSTYTVSSSGDNLVLTSDVSGEVNTYQKATIPASVKEEAYEQ